MRGLDGHLEIGRFKGLTGRSREGSKKGLKYGFLGVLRGPGTERELEWVY